MKTEQRRILTVTDGIICQQVNCQQVMQARLALEIRNKWPIVYQQYMGRTLGLGDCDVVIIDGQLAVANLYAQDDYGHGRKFTNYCAFSAALSRLRLVAAAMPDRNNQVHFPYGIGYGLAGGDWRVISELIEYYFPDAILYKVG